MSKLTSALREAKEKNFSQIMNTINEYDDSPLLLGAYNAEKDTLNELGLNHSSNADDQKTQIFLKTKQSEKQFDMESFSGSDIKKICLKYCLSINPISKYRGEIPHDFAKKVLDFSILKGVKVRRDAFYVLAPFENFENQSDGKMSSKLCTLFYKEPDTYSSRLEEVKKNDVLIHIMEWGTEYSFFDKLRFMFNGFSESAEVSMRFITNAVFILFGISLIVGFVINLFMLSLIPLTISIIIIVNQITAKTTTDNLWNGKL